MAYPGKVIRNLKTGQQLRFIRTAKETTGTLLEMETVFEPWSKEPPPHYHPRQQEVFTVTSGALSVRINGNVQTLFAGHTLTIPANCIHSMWNATDETTVVNWQVIPALDTEYFLETIMGMAGYRPTNQAGVPGLLQLVATANRFHREFRLAKPSFGLQKILFTLLLPFAYLAGRRSQYPEYID